MDFELSDYLKFYWVLYFTVREKEFPKGTWRGLIDHRSPQLWTYEIQKKETIGNKLFRTGAKFFYLITTKYSSQKTYYQSVDYRPLIIAFKLMGCIISEEEIIARSIAEPELPEAQFDLFKDKYPEFVKQFPDLEISVKEMLEERVKKIGDKVSYQNIDKSVPLAEKKDEEVRRSKESKDKQLPPSISEAFSTFINFSKLAIDEKITPEEKYLQTHRESLSLCLTDFLGLISTGNFLGAFECWYPQDRQKMWQGNVRLFRDEWNIYASILSDMIWDFKMTKILTGEIYGSCICFYEGVSIIDKADKENDIKIINLDVIDGIYFDKIKKSASDGASRDRLKKALSRPRLERYTKLPEEIKLDFPQYYNGRILNLMFVGFRRFRTKWYIYKISPLRVNGGYYAYDKVDFESFKYTSSVLGLFGIPPSKSKK